MLFRSTVCAALLISSAAASSSLPDAPNDRVEAALERLVAEGKRQENVAKAELDFIQKTIAAVHAADRSNIRAINNALAAYRAKHSDPNLRYDSPADWCRVINVIRTDRMRALFNVERALAAQIQAHGEGVLYRTVKSELLLAQIKDEPVALGDVETAVLRNGKYDDELANLRSRDEPTEMDRPMSDDIVSEC